MRCAQPKGAENHENLQGIFCQSGFQKRYPLDRISPADFPADFPINFPADFPADSPADFLSRFPSKFPSRFPSKNFPAEFPVEEKDEQCYWFEGWFSREFSGKIRVWVRAKQGMIPQLDLLTPNEADEKKHEQCYWFEGWFLRKIPGMIFTSSGKVFSSSSGIPETRFAYPKQSA